MHSACPVAQHPGPDDNNREAAVRSIEDIHGMADALGVKVALEVMGNNLSTAPDLVEMLERSFEGADLGICMDVGHAHILGDTAEAIETTSEYLVTTHIHDNRGRATTISCLSRATSTGPRRIMAFEKIGYDGVLMYEVRAAESPRAVLERAVSARRQARSVDGG